MEEQLRDLIRLLPADAQELLKQQPAVAVSIVVVLATILLFVLLRLLLGSKGGSIVVIAGPCNAGKSCLFYQLKDGTVHNGMVASMEENEGSCQVRGMGSWPLCCLLPCQTTSRCCPLPPSPFPPLPDEGRGLQAVMRPPPPQGMDYRPSYCPSPLPSPARLRDCRPTPLRCPLSHPDPPQVKDDKGRARGQVKLVDVPGHPRLRHKLEQHLRDAKAVVLVVDAAEITPQRVEAAEELFEVRLTLGFRV